MNYYKPGECKVHYMTPEELEEDRKRREEERQKHLWRYQGNTPISDYKSYLSEQKFRNAVGKKRK